MSKLTCVFALYGYCETSAKLFTILPSIFELLTFKTQLPVPFVSVPVTLFSSLDWLLVPSKGSITKLSVQ